MKATIEVIIEPRENTEKMIVIAMIQRGVLANRVDGAEILLFVVIGNIDVFIAFLLASFIFVYKNIFIVMKISFSSNAHKIIVEVDKKF